MTTAPSTAPPDATDLSLRDASAARHLHSIDELLQERVDLQGVHPLAEVVVDSVRWSA